MEEDAGYASARLTTSIRSSCPPRISDGAAKFQLMGHRLNTVAISESSAHYQAEASPGRLTSARTILSIAQSSRRLPGHPSRTTDENVRVCRLRSAPPAPYLRRQPERSCCWQLRWVMAKFGRAKRRQSSHRARSLCDASRAGRGSRQDLRGARPARVVGQAGRKAGGGGRVREYDRGLQVTAPQAARHSACRSAPEAGPGGV